MAEIESISLSELLISIKGIIAHGVEDLYWIRAEISDINENSSQGHCYLELVEKDETIQSTILAKCKAIIWADTYHLIKPYFYKETGQTLKTGMKIMVAVTPTFSEKFGFSCYIRDIEPSFTIGNLAINKQKVIQQLHDDGIWDMNHSLKLPTPLRRIAIISSKTAAGYGDFMDQLGKRKEFSFFTQIFPSIMQGDEAAASIIDSLDKIYEEQEKYDAVVIIRGGGATTDLLAFDEYDLASCCAQFPLPIITGIGHERDNSVVDMVANTRCKTPTAVAEFIIKRMEETVSQLDNLTEALHDIIEECITQNRLRLKYLASNLSLLTANRMRDEHIFTERIGNHLRSAIRTRIDEERNYAKQQGELLKNILRERLRDEANYISQIRGTLIQKLSTTIAEERGRLQSKEVSAKLLSPDQILKRGYSITLKNGKAVKNANALKSGEKITTLFAKGQIESTVD
ncbi:MAG: exodeoxyribonuclease VII large subunit [Paludibacteraceae bacterium]|nr:exodeoxyribonuclease VII large subunit [Paludibacteraceae bacterium]